MLLLLYSRLNGLIQLKLQLNVISVASLELDFIGADETVVLCVIFGFSYLDPRVLKNINQEVFSWSNTICGHFASFARDSLGTFRRAFISILALQNPDYSRQPMSDLCLFTTEHLRGY